MPGFSAGRENPKQKDKGGIHLLARLNIPLAKIKRPGLIKKGKSRRPASA